jgi:hypothetical protein
METQDLIPLRNVLLLVAGILGLKTTANTWLNHEIWNQRFVDSLRKQFQNDVLGHRSCCYGEQNAIYLIDQAWGMVSGDPLRVQCMLSQARDFCIEHDLPDLFATIE